MLKLFIEETEIFEILIVKFSEYYKMLPETLSLIFNNEISDKYLENEQDERNLNWLNLLN